MTKEKQKRNCECSHGPYKSGGVRFDADAKRWVMGARCHACHTEDVIYVFKSQPGFLSAIMEGGTVYVLDKDDGVVLLPTGKQRPPALVLQPTDRGILHHYSYQGQERYLCQTCGHVIHIRETP